MTEEVIEQAVMGVNRQEEGRAPIVVQPVHTLSAPDAAAEVREYEQAADQAFFSDAAPGQQNMSALSDRLLREFNQAVQDRRDTEVRWLKDLRQYRGKYDPDVEASLAGHSKAFVRKTRVKIKTVDSRVMDLVFPAGANKNWSIRHTPKPKVSQEMLQTVSQELAAAGTQPTRDQIDQHVKQVAEQAAKRMGEVIDDQLVEVKYKTACRQTIHSGHLYGTGVLKGPLVERRVRTRFEQRGKKWLPVSEYYTVPFVENVPLWRWYPDMASTELGQCQFVFERHLMTAHGLLGLADRGSFKASRQIIIDYVKAHPGGMATLAREYDAELKDLGDRQAKASTQDGLYEVLERNGYLSGEDLAQIGVKVPQQRLHERFFSNVWMLPNGQVIKAVLPPIDGQTWPYHIYYFDKDETSIFGEGLASVMREDQDMLNAAVRMMLDNGALTSGPMVEVFLDRLASTEHATSIVPWKLIFRNGKDPEQPAYKPIELDNNIEWLSKMAEIFDNNTDEVTAIPRYMSGENATSGAAGTARGMSMLMAAANIVIKDLINGWDEVTASFITALYHWNMKFHKDSSIKGDFDVAASGTASLVAKEIRAQSLAEFTTTLAPEDAPFIKRHELLQQRAEAMELTDVVKTKDEVKADQESEEGKRMAQMQRELQEAQLATAKAQADKLLAEAQVAKTKVEEMLANIDVLVAKAVSTKVETIFAALQAGGVATRDPLTAPAGDAILQDAGYREAVPDPSTAQLNSPPVQATQGTTRLMNKGQTFAVEPRAGTGQPQPPGNVDPQAATPPDPGPAPGAVEMRDANTGQRAGIETVRIE